MPFFVLKKRSIIMFLIIFTVIASASIWFYSNSDSVTAFSQKDNKVREIHMVTGEYKTELENGEELEIYRWDPGTIFLEKDEKVNLKILGVNGNEHPFYVEGTDIRGIVKKGEESVVPLQFEKKGTYRLICDAHSAHGHKWTMIAYIVVD